MNQTTTYRWSFEDDVYAYRRAGFEAIGIWRPKLSDYGEEKGMELLAECGLKASVLHWAGGFTGSDGRSHEEALIDARSAIHTAAMLQAGALTLHSGGRARHTHNHSRRLLYGAINKLLPLAEEFGVTLLLEPMHARCAEDFTILTSLQDACDTIAMFESDCLKLTLDTYSFGDISLVERLPGLVPHIGLVQLADSHTAPRAEQNRCPLGRGRLPLRDILDCLGDFGYEGPIEIELSGEEIETADYRTLLEDSRRYCEELLGPVRTATP